MLAGHSHCGRFIHPNVTNQDRYEVDAAVLRTSVKVLRLLQLVCWLRRQIIAFDIIN